jgi:hypothetical protein
MRKYYCHKCSAEKGFLNSVDNLNFTGSSYQLDKFLKHTVPSNQSGLLSVFDSGSYDQYKNHIVNTMASGSTEIDSHNRKNIVWFAGSNNGLSFKDDTLEMPTDSVKVVLSDNDDKIHAFPTSSNDIQHKKCDECGSDIIA